MKTGGSMELDAVLWSGLPFEMVERVLSFLPVPNLCRYRSVCKTWDRLIRSPEFGAICVQCVSKRDASFIGMRCILGSTKKTDAEVWYFLDLDARRWYTVKGYLREPEFGGWVMAMDGGLICRYLSPIVYTQFNDRVAQCFSIIVYSPIASAMKKLPSVLGHVKSTRCAVLTLVVDNISQRFKVFLINQHICASLTTSLKIQDDPLMRVYDSATNEWQDSTDPFCITSRGVGAISSTVVLHGFLYAVFDSRTRDVEGHRQVIDEEIWRYNIEKDVWEKVNVNISGVLDPPKLFVSTNRLFLIGWVFDESSWTIDLQLEVHEIKLPGMILERVVKMSKADAVELFDNNRSLRNPQIVACGYGANSILLICKSSQKMMVLDLDTRLWDQLPANPVWTHPGQESYYHRFEGCFVNPISHMNLILPSSLWR